MVARRKLPSNEQRKDLNHATIFFSAIDASERNYMTVSLSMVQRQILPCLGRSIVHRLCMGCDNQKNDLMIWVYCELAKERSNTTGSPMFAGQKMGSRENIPPGAFQLFLTNMVDNLGTRAFFRQNTKDCSFLKSIFSILPLLVRTFIPIMQGEQFLYERSTASCKRVSYVSWSIHAEYLTTGTL